MADDKLDLVTKFLQDLTLAKGRWSSENIRPFANAYETAFLSYKDVLDSQKKADEKHRELLMMGLLLVGGGAFTAAFGAATAKTVIKEAAVKVICNREMERTFKAAAIIEASPVLSFGMGELYTKTETWLSDAAKAKLKESLPKVIDPPKRETPFRLLNTMQMTLENAENAARAAAIDIRDNGAMDMDHTSIALNMLRRAPIMRTPSPFGDEKKVAKVLELMMFLELIMSRDKVVTKRFVWRGNSGSYREVSRKDITALPGSEHYPKGQPGNHMRGGPKRDIVIEDLGGEIDSHVNKLGREILGKPLLRERSWTSPLAELTADEIVKASRCLDELAKKHASSPFAKF